MRQSSTDPAIRTILSSICPDYRGDVRVEPMTAPVRTNSYWDGGGRYRHYLAAVDGSRSPMLISAGHPQFDGCGTRQCQPVPPGCVLVVIREGSYRLVRVYANPENLQQLLPAASGPELTDLQRRQLACIAATKGGAYRRDEFRRGRLGEYSADNPDIASLISQGFLAINKAGHIRTTLEGRQLADTLPRHM